MNFKISSALLTASLVAATAQAQGCSSGQIGFGNIFNVGNTLGAIVNGCNVVDHTVSGIDGSAQDHGVCQGSYTSGSNIACVEDGKHNVDSFIINTNGEHFGNCQSIGTDNSCASNLSLFFCCSPV